VRYGPGLESRRRGGSLKALFHRLQAFFHPSDREAGLRAELHFHLEEEAERRRQEGLAPNEASFAALRNFGNVTLIAEDARAVWLPLWFQQVAQDARYGVRMLCRDPGFAVASIVMLALGIGLNGAVGSVINAEFFKGFRRIDNQRIVYITSQKNGRYGGVSWPDFEDWRSQAKSFDGMGAVAGLEITLDNPGGPGEHYIATEVTANAFQALGVKPILGRDFASSDEVRGAAPVAILSYKFWVSRYGKDPGVIGRRVYFDGGTTTVIGVMPEGFSFPQDQILWVPLIPTVELQRRDARSLWFAFGHLADGVNRESAGSELQVIGERLANIYPLTNQGQRPRIQDFTEWFLVLQAGHLPATYGVLSGAAGFVLLIVCVNLINLNLARATGRARELAVRIALGAGRWRIVRQLLVESLILSAIGGASGWALAHSAVRVYALAVNPLAGQSDHDLLDYTMDYRVLAYITGISIGTAFLFGLVPALFASRLDLQTTLKDGGNWATGGTGRRRLGRLLVIGEIAMALVLLTGAGMMIRSYRHIAADLGVRTTTLSMRLSAPPGKYSDREAQRSFLEQLRTHLEGIPGVASLSSGPLPGGGIRGSERPYQLDDSEMVHGGDGSAVTVLTIAPDYFRTLGAIMLSGREFTRTDATPGARVAIVNERFVREHWPSKSALGQRLRVGSSAVDPAAWLSVIGVVSNIEFDRAGRQELTPLVFVPGQEPLGSFLFVRTSIPSAGLIPALRKEISALDPRVAIQQGPYPMSTWLARRTSYGGVRNNSVTLVIFALIALLLAAIGLYAVIAHSIGRRTKEIGVRMAIGAAAEDIRGMVLHYGMLPVAIGMVPGLAASLALSRILRSQFVGVSSYDPVTITVAPVILIVTALLACLIPARRAMRVDPVVVLRHD
jgi:putative ABC transport system permease protein